MGFGEQLWEVEPGRLRSRKGQRGRSDGKQEQRQSYVAKFWNRTEDLAYSRKGIMGWPGVYAARETDRCRKAGLLEGLRCWIQRPLRLIERFDFYRAFYLITRSTLKTYGGYGPSYKWWPYEQYERLLQLAP